MTEPDDYEAQRLRARQDEHLEPFEDALAALVDAVDEDGVPALVEGDKDEAALRNLGVTGRIVKVHNTAGGILAVAERLVREGHASAVLLTDWDRTGGRLARRLREVCAANGVKLDDSHRLAFLKATRGEVRTVEALDTWYRNLKGPPHS